MTSIIFALFLCMPQYCEMQGVNYGAFADFPPEVYSTLSACQHSWYRAGNIPLYNGQGPPPTGVYYECLGRPINMWGRVR